MKLKKQNLFKWLPFLSFFVAFPLVGNAATKSDLFATYADAFQAGNYAAAYNAGVEAISEKPEDKSNLLWQLYVGSAAQLAGKPEEAIKFHVFAENTFRAIDAEAETVGGKAKTALRGLGTTVDFLGGDLMLAYKGKVYERIMLGAHLGLTRLTMGDYPGATVEFNRMSDWQTQALERFRADLAKIEKEKEKESQKPEETQENTTTQKTGFWKKVGKGIGEAGKAVGKGVSEAFSKDNMLDALSFGQHEEHINSLLGTGVNSAFTPNEADIQNPYATWTAGLVALLMDDPEKGRGILLTAAELVPENTCAATDAKNASELWSALAARQDSLADNLRAKNLNNRVWIIVENGLAPTRTDLHVGLPAWIFTNRVYYTGFSIAVLNDNPPLHAAYNIETATATVPAKILSDMDRVVRTEYQKNFRAMLTREILRTLIKTSLQAVASNQDKNGNNTTSSLLTLGAAIYQMATTRADLREWWTLPKNYLVAALPIPPDRKLTIRPADNSPHTTTITLPPCENAIVYYRAPISLATQTTPRVILFQSQN